MIFGKKEEVETNKGTEITINTAPIVFTSEEPILRIYFKKGDHCGKIGTCYGRSGTNMDLSVLIYFPTMDSSIFQFIRLSEEQLKSADVVLLKS